MHKSPVKVHQGALLWSATDPWLRPSGTADFHYFRDGAIAFDQAGTIIDSGPSTMVLPRFPQAEIIQHGEKILVPGMIDLHIHAPQLDLIGAPAEGLLEWLEKHTFPQELQYGDLDYAQDASLAFAHELRAYGTSTAVVYSSSFAAHTFALGQCLSDMGLRTIIGNCSMDRHAPGGLLHSAQDDLKQSSTLIAAWAKYQPLSHYALTPRFVPSCTPELLGILGDLAKAHPELYIQTHHAENHDEIAWVKALEPKALDYLGVYEHYGLLGPRSILAHVIHATEAELFRIAKARATVAHCPTSNLFLGSGLFPFAKVAKLGIKIGLGTDVGGGTSFSMWQTMAEAYKVSMLVGEALNPAQLFYAATVGGALGIGRADLGAFHQGQRADFMVIDPEKHRLLRRRKLLQLDPRDIVFALIHHVDDRCIDALFVEGRPVGNIVS